MRYGAKVDVMHGPIREGLRKAGVFVLDLSKAGKGCPDLLCHTRHTGWVPLEVKTRRQDCKRTKAGPLTPAQVALHEQAPIAVVEAIDQALQIFGLSDPHGQTGTGKCRRTKEDHARVERQP